MAKLISGRGKEPSINPVILPPVIHPVEPTTTTAAYPTGNVKTKRPGRTETYNIPWTQVSRWDALWAEGVRKYPNVPREVMEGIAVLETGASHYTHDRMTGVRSEVRVRPYDSWDRYEAVGMMQLKPHYHQHRIPSADPYLPNGNVMLAYALMSEGIKEFGTWQEAIRRKYFPGDDPATRTTQQTYIDTISSLVSELKAVRSPIVINPPPQLDPMEAIFGQGNRPKIFFGWLERGGVGYPYGVNHGTTDQEQHTGLDIDVPFGTKFYSPAAGKILCVGKSGSGVWGQACGFFADTGYGGPGSREVGVGNITLLCDSGHKIVFGHSRTCNFRPGDRVKAGDWLGTTGGMLSPHMHLEVAIDEPNKVLTSDRLKGITYWLVNPLPAIRIAMGQPTVIVKPTQPITDIIWVGTHNFHDRQGQAPVAIFYHVTDDMNYTNVKSWFQNSSSKASAHFVIGRGGEKYQFVVSGKAAWTNGVISRPRTDIRWINEALKSGRNFNDFTLNLEFIGKPGESFTNEQIESGIEISKYYVATNTGILLNRGHFNRHADVDRTNRAYCPSNSFPLAEIIQECGGDPLILNP